MALAKEIYATYRAERLREKVKEKAAFKYLKVRSLLDQADNLIMEAQLPRAMKNQFAAKILRARKELDLGDCPNKVSENVQDIVTILKEEVRDATKALNDALGCAARNMDCTDRKKSGSLLPSAMRALNHPNHLHNLKQFKMAKQESSDCKDISRYADAGDALMPDSKKLRMSAKHSKPVSSWYDTENEEDRKRMELELTEECGTLDTLHFALRILNEMGRPDLSPEEVRDLEMTMKRTKRMLLNRRECQKLRVPLERLQYVMERPKAERAVALKAALQLVHKAVNAFEVLENLNTKKL